MPIYKRCDESVSDMAAELIERYRDGDHGHQSLIDCKAKIDFVFAYADRDDAGNRTNDALTLGGVRCLGIARKIGPKDRALGRGDAEIALDGDEWPAMTREKQLALLDHELTHLTVKKDKYGVYCTDDQHRPLIRIRPHTHEVGWFDVTAIRHRENSVECIQAKAIMDECGQFYWPGMGEAVPLELLKKRGY